MSAPGAWLSITSREVYGPPAARNRVASPQTGQANTARNELAISRQSPTVRRWLGHLAGGGADDRGSNSNAWFSGVPVVGCPAPIALPSQVPHSASPSGKTEAASASMSWTPCPHHVCNELRENRVWWTPDRGRCHRPMP